MKFMKKIALISWFLFFLPQTIKADDWPRPDIVSVNYSDSLQVGETGWIRVKVWNFGAFSDYGAIYVSFPSLINTGDVSWTEEHPSSSPGNPGYQEIPSGTNFPYFASVQANYLAVEFADNDWDTGEYKSLYLRVTPQTAGQLRFLVRAGMRNPNTGQFLFEPNSTGVSDHIWKAEEYTIDVFSQPPRIKPEIRDIICPDIINLGDTVRVEFEANNAGCGEADYYASISASFPSFTQPTDQQFISNRSTSQGTPGYQEFPSGSLIYHQNGSQMTASKLLVEYADIPWDPDDWNSLDLWVTPQEAGEFEILVRVTMKCDHSECTVVQDCQAPCTECDNWVSSPSSSSFYDQQGWNVYRYIINVQTVEPDLVSLNPTVNSHAAPIVPFPVGTSLELKSQVTNNGLNSSGENRLGFYLGNSPSDLSNRLGDVQFPTIDYNVTLQGTLNYMLGTSDIGSNKYIVFKADDLEEVVEADETNNLISWGPFEVTAIPPDVDLLEPQVTQTVTQGELINISWNGTSGSGTSTSVKVGYDPDVVANNGNTTWVIQNRPEDGTYLWNTFGVLPGDYYIHLKIDEGDLYGYDVSTFQITIEENNEPIIANFSYSPIDPGVGVPVQFTDQSCCDIETWSWDFDGDEQWDSHEQNPIYTYNSPGSYSVKLEVNNPYGPDQIILDVQVLGDGSAPVITNVVRQFPGVFPEGLDLNIPIELTIDWAGSPGTISSALNFVPLDDVPGTATGGVVTVNVTALESGLNNLIITLENGEGVQGDSWIEPFYLFPYPNWIPEGVVPTITITSDEAIFAINVEHPMPHIGDDDNPTTIWIPNFIPYLGGAHFGLMETFTILNGQVSTRGWGEFTIEGQTGFTALGSTVQGNMNGSADVEFYAPLGMQLTAAMMRLRLRGTIAKELGVVEAIPQLAPLVDLPVIGGPIGWFNERAKLIGEISPSLEFYAYFDQDEFGELIFSNGTGQLGVDLKVTLQIDIAGDNLTASGWVAGGGSFTLGVPEPYLRAAEIHTEAGIAFKLDYIFEVNWEATIGAEVTWTPEDGVQTKITTNEQNKKVYESGIRKLKHTYLDYGNYSVFNLQGMEKTSNQKTMSSVNQSSLVSNLFPGASPRLAVYNTNRLLVWEHQDQNDIDVQSTEIAWSYYSNGSWSNPNWIQDNTQAEFAPKIAADDQGNFVAVWTQISDPAYSQPINNATQLGSFYKETEVVTSVFDPQNQTWSPVVSLTNDYSLDFDLKLAHDSQGNIVLTWVKNEDAEFIAKNTSPSEVFFCLWDSATQTWSSPTSILGPLANLVSQNVAVHGTSVVLILNRKDIGNTHGYLESLEWDGLQWTSPSLFSNSSSDNRNVQVVFDNTGEGHVIWVQNDQMVQATLSSPTPIQIRSNSASLAFYGAELVNNGSDNLTLLFYEVDNNGPANLFALIFDTSTQTWSQDIRLNADPGLSYDMSGGYDASGVFHGVYLSSTILRENREVSNGTASWVIPNIPIVGRTDMRLIEVPLVLDLLTSDDDIQITPTNPQVNEPVELRISVQNFGSFPTDTFSVGVYAGDPDQGGSLLDSSNIQGPFAAGSETELVFNFNFPAGQPNLIVKIDDQLQVDEFSEDNNKATFYLNNRAPQARVLANVTSGEAPLLVHFDARSSSDPDDDEMSYRWTFSDGSQNQIGDQASHAFVQEGQYPVTITVSDDKGAVAIAVVMITVSPCSYPGILDIDGNGIGNNDDWFYLTSHWLDSGQDYPECNIDGTGNINVLDFIDIARCFMPTMPNIPPQIHEFSSYPTGIHSGQSAILAWECDFTDTISISNLLGVFSPHGSVEVTPSTTTVYTLTATGTGGTSTSQFILPVFGNVPPSITLFDASPNPVQQGSTSILTWDVTNADSVSIDQGIGVINSSGTTQLTPNQTTTYILTATNSHGSSNSSVTVTVLASPVIDTFQASPSTIQPGESSTLTWTTTNATSVSIDLGIGNQAVDGAVQVSPTEITTYTLTATGPGGSTNQSVTISVGQSGTLWETDAIVGDLNLISAGSFIQGSPTGEACRDDDEEQFAHTLTRSFIAMVTEVTSQMWTDLQTLQPTLGSNPTYIPHSPTNSHPVQHLYWHQAILFANLLSIERGLSPCYYVNATYTTPIDATNYTSGTYFCDWDANGYRLPTEGEWEALARGGISTPFSIDEPNYGTANCSTCGPFPGLSSVAVLCTSSIKAAVTSRAANPFGLFDVHGNVWEWCWDWKGVYPNSPVTDYTGPGFGNARVIRGGSCSDEAQYLRSASRHGEASAHPDIGFRLVRTLP